MPQVIKPTIGRRVWYWPSEADKKAMAYSAGTPPQPCDAGVVFVHSDRMVNLQVQDHNGASYSRTSVTLVQPGDETPQGAYACWMPYQTSQAQASADVGTTAT